MHVIVDVAAVSTNAVVAPSMVACIGYVVPIYTVAVMNVEIGTTSEVVTVVVDNITIVVQLVVDIATVVVVGVVVVVVVASVEDTTMAFHCSTINGSLLWSCMLLSILPA